MEHFPNLEKLRSSSTSTQCELAASIRRYLLETVSITGGHIGANLGTVELTIALHSIFESPKDVIMFDTGHQGYTHRILTGRANSIQLLNRVGGTSRFLSRAESCHDPIDASHAGTALSLAIGIAIARRMVQPDAVVVCVVGDGAITEGMSLEALNYLSSINLPVVIVINDNGFAISPSAGGIHNALSSKNGGAANFFRALGYSYCGPVNGHNIADLKTVFSEVRTNPVNQVVHVRTKKGAGWPPADVHPYRLHFSFPFDPISGELQTSNSVETFPDIASRVIERAMDQNEKIHCITPSTIYATGFARLFARFPGRCFDPGMAEQGAMGIACGMALGGLIPVIAYQSTFMQRAFDQLLHDICYQSANVLLLCTRSGFSGYDGPTHHGIFDLAYLNCLPNLKILCPKDGFELGRMVYDQLRDQSGPKAILMPYGEAYFLDQSVEDETDYSFSHPQLFYSGDFLTFICVGASFKEALGAANALRSRGIDIGLINMRVVAPLPIDALIHHCRTCSRLVIVEEYVEGGSVGSDLVGKLRARMGAVDVLRVGLPVEFIPAGSNEELRAMYGLDTAGLVRLVEGRWRDLLP